MKEIVEQLVADALRAAVTAGELALDTSEVLDPAVERPRESAHGDWASALALRLAKVVHKNPREVAKIIASHIGESDDIAQVEIAGPGFINMRLSQSAQMRIVREIRQLDRHYGASKIGAGKRLQVEFVSANPVGPMHVGHGRWAALGDSMARVLAHTGYEVAREFYINDAGVQMDIFGRSLSIRYLQLCGIDVAMPQDGYQGSYITDIAQTIKDDEGDRWVEVPALEREEHFRERGYREVLAHLQSFLHDFGVDFDRWFSERLLYEGDPDAVKQAIDVLREGGYLYEKADALWFRATDFGDDKDRVLIKADGAYTYFAADIAYHKDKFDRGFERVVDIWGADHHGYVARMKAACAALGHEGRLDVVIGQLVNLFRNGEAVRMSKRTGEMITFEELVDEVGADAARYWFLRRSTDQQVDFDITAAVEQSAENPIYYVQYAHARICSIIRKAYGAKPDADADTLVTSLALDCNLSGLNKAAELALVRKLGELSDVIELASRDLAPYKLTHYSEDLAAAFHHFYAHCRVMDGDGSFNEARLALCDATRRCLRVCFDLLGIAAPERM